MCPDRQLLSVYLDHELPAPWKEKLETHVRDCPDCQVRLERYRRVSAALAGSPPREASSAPGEGAADRVWRNISRGIAGKTGHSNRWLWNRRVSLPLPAVAAAAALLVLACTLALAGGPLRFSQPRESAFAGVEPTLQEVLPASSEMAVSSEEDNLLRYLGREDRNDMVIIQLPESKSFMSSGKPIIIKASDYSRSTGTR